eukprot:COSAG06_NODE_23499_length_689_cov_2.569492_1_plen_128_part_00
MEAVITVFEGTSEAGDWLQAAVKGDTDFISREGAPCHNITHKVLEDMYGGIGFYDFGFGHGQQLLTAAAHKPSEEVFIGGCEVVSERLEMLRDQILPALGLDTDITITGPISDETPEQMFAFLHEKI